MAKIKFGDYLKSKERREAVYESDELIAKRARALIDADSYAVQPKFRVENYKKAMDLLEQIPDHPDAAGMLEECRAGISQAQADMARTDFEKGRYHLENAATEHEFKKSSEELAALSKELKQQKVDLSKRQNASDAAGSAPEYEDMIRQTEAMKVQAEEKVAIYAKKTTRSRYIALIVFLAIVAALIYAMVSGYGWYLAAKIEGLSGMYDSAYSRFYKLGDYLDSREQYQLYKEKYLRQREQEESRDLPDADVGDTVAFSGFNWLVLEKEDTTLRLICTAPDKNSVFFGVSYDGPQKKLREEMSIEPETDEAEHMADEESAVTESEQTEADQQSAAGKGGSAGRTEETADPEKSTTWKDSSLRAYLNETVPEHEFTPAEIAAMVPQNSEPTQNAQYGTKQEETVEDLVSILSAEQVQAYLEDGVMKTPSVDMWLRTPGHDLHSAAYMTSKGNIILYGNDVTDDSLSVCPMIVVDYTKMESE